MIELSHIHKSFLIDQTQEDVHLEYLNGAVIGGFLDLQRLDEIAISYLKSAEMLVEYTSENRDIAYEYAYPIIFLTRHALELKLKSIMPNFKESHSFHALRDNFLVFVEKYSDNKLRENLKNRINEFVEIDHKSTRFRYGSEPKDEFLVNLNTMFYVVKEVFLIIDGIENNSNL